MDRITKTLLDTFVKEESLVPADESEAFEHFANYAVISSEYPEQFDIEDVHAGSGNDIGLDGIAIIVNGTLVCDTDEIDDLLATNRHLEVTFLFIQAKTSSKFDTAEFGTFTFGVKDFFAEHPKLPRNEAITEFAALTEHLFKNSISMRRKPACKLFYVTTGKWQDDIHFKGRMSAEQSDLEQLNIFECVHIAPVDANTLHGLYQATKNKVQTHGQRAFCAASAM